MFFDGAKWQIVFVQKQHFIRTEQMIKLIRAEDSLEYQLLRQST